MAQGRIKTHNEQSAISMAKLYKRRSQARLCVVCGGQRTDQRVICGECRQRRTAKHHAREQLRHAAPVTEARLLEWSSLSKRQQYAYAKERQLCPKCGAPLARAAFVYCLPCRVNQQIVSERYRNKRKAQVQA
jgi:predicted amidophosphoribosyltransferase